MSKIQSRDHRLRTYEINKISWPSFDGKIYIRKMEMTDYFSNIRVNYKKKIILITIQKKLFWQAYCFNFHSNKDSLLVNLLKYCQTFGISNLEKVANFMSEIFQKEIFLTRTHRIKA